MIRTIITAALGGTAIAIAGPALAAPGGGLAGGLGGAVGGTLGGGAGVGGGVGGSVGSSGAGAVGGSVGGGMSAGASGNVGAGGGAIMGAGQTGTRIHSQGSTNVSTRATTSQGLVDALPNAIAHANSNSVLARGAVNASALPGLSTGLSVRTSSGATLGKVSRVVTGADGSIRAVVVTSPSGKIVQLPPSSLSVSGGVVTTTGG